MENCEKPVQNNKKKRSRRILRMNKRLEKELESTSLKKEGCVGRLPLFSGTLGRNRLNLHVSRN